MIHHVDVLSLRLVPDELWAFVEPSLPPAGMRRQGGGRSVAQPRKVFTAIVFVVTSGCAWRHLPPSFDVAVPTAHRWFVTWSAHGLWERLRNAVAAQPDEGACADWLTAIIDAASTRAGALSD
nr:Mobile element protein [Kibdelosporangium sp. MJ126-NF4]CTQ97188.1 Mobile element protein [Kibdelosporangium sp. MJ126-NF4]